MDAELYHSRDLFIDATVREDNGAFTQEVLLGSGLKLCLSGVGKVNAASAAVTLLGEYQVDSLVSIGVSGSLVEDFCVGDLVLVTETLEHDLDLRPIIEKPGLTMGQSSPFYRSHSDITEKLKDIVEPLLDSWSSKVYERFGSQASLRKGIVATGDSLITSLQQKKAITKDFPSVQLVDMETAAVAKVAKIRGVPWGALRIVSDSADSKDAARDIFEFCAWEGSKLIALTIAHLMETEVEFNEVSDGI